MREIEWSVHNDDKKEEEWREKADKLMSSQPFWDALAQLLSAINTGPAPKEEKKVKERMLGYVFEIETVPLADARTKIHVRCVSAPDPDGEIRVFGRHDGSMFPRSGDTMNCVTFVTSLPLREWKRQFKAEVRQHRLLERPLDF